MAKEIHIAPNCTTINDTDKLEIQTIWPKSVTVEIWHTDNSYRISLKIEELVSAWEKANPIPSK